MVDKKEFFHKVRTCKALQDKKVEDVIAMPEYNEELAALIDEQRSTREVFLKANYGRAKRHVIDSLLEQDVMNVDTMKELYLLALEKRLNASASCRAYITQLCNRAYRNVVRRIVLDEFPELRENFYGKEN